MNSNQQKTAAERIAENKKQEIENFKVERRESQQPIQQSPSASSSSPSHEFSFTISLHSDKLSKSSTPNSFAIDLSPADEIFFHGHLLPLHLLSHLPSSPRSSTDTFANLPTKHTSNCTTKQQEESQPTQPTGGRIIKSKPFSLFGFAKWRKGCETSTEQDDEEKHKRKLGFDVGQVLKRYAKVITPLLFFRWRKENLHIRRQAYSFSGDLNPRNEQESRRRRRIRRKGEFSAPASMRTSPTNSGLLVADPCMNCTSDSTMEELQSAIQAAIAHCKNSIAKEDRNQCQELI